MCIIQADFLRRYCSEPKDARVLCALLHAAGDEETGDASCVSEVPGMIIAWDLFGLFSTDEDIEAAREETKDSAEEKAVPSIRSE